jgi:prevent-host-death family protein
VIRLNVDEAKAHLSRYLKRVEAGETLVLCRRNRPIAEVRPIREAPRQGQRQFGLDEGKFTMGVPPPALPRNRPSAAVRASSYAVS